MSSRWNEFAAYVAMLALAACGSNGTAGLPGSAGTIAAPMQSHPAAAPVCAGVRRDAAACDALITNQTSSNLARGASLGGYGPADLESAYNLPSASKGSGQIVAVVDAYDNPNVTSDLDAYRSTFGLPAANFTKYNQEGQTYNYPQADQDWGVEIDTDVDMVSASCPNCTIYLVEANSSTFLDLGMAALEAVKLGAHIVSNSYSGTGAIQKDYGSKGVAYLASSGDGGSVGEPAAFDSVAAVGGTTLTKGGGGKRGWTESVWGGLQNGCTNQPKPPWQDDRSCAHRLANDVSAVANPSVAVYDSYGFGGWLQILGTAVSAPFLAGVFGLAGNAAQQDGGRTFWQTAHHKYLYVVKSGNPGRYSIGGGWGSPDGVGAF